MKPSLKVLLIFGIIGGMMSAKDTYARSRNMADHQKISVDANNSPVDTEPKDTEPEEGCEGICSGRCRSECLSDETEVGGLCSGECKCCAKPYDMILY